LDNTIDYSKKINLAAPDLIEQFTPAQLVDAVKYSVNAERSANIEMTIAFTFNDLGETHALEVRRGVVEFHKDFTGTADATATMSKMVYLGVMMGQVDFVEGVSAGQITVDGNAVLVPEFYSLFDKTVESVALTLR
jgi:alkyl sulfatase BDS1-like metallo-beta-lactamase superfamily hydrolase